MTNRHVFNSNLAVNDYLQCWHTLQIMLVDFVQIYKNITPIYLKLIETLF